jgi:hypothetical protein
MNYLLYYATNQKKFKICGDIMRLRFEFSIRRRTLNLFISTFADAASPVSRFVPQADHTGGLDSLFCDSTESSRMETEVIHEKLQKGLECEALIRFGIFFCVIQSVI